MIALSKIQTLLADASLANLAAVCADVSPSLSVGPGDHPANLRANGCLFAKFCPQTLPDFATTKVVPAPDGEHCSIVFGSSNTAPPDTQSFSAEVTRVVGDFTASFTRLPPRPSANSFSHYSARTNAQ